MPIPFSKYSGCGNDFVVIDNRSAIFADRCSQATISRLCHRQFGIGADGIILLENSDKADYRMRIFNADGSEAEMCGNGVRCLALFIHELQLANKKFTLETMHQKMQICVEGSKVCVYLPPVTEFKYFIPLSIEGRELTLHSLNTGVPHVVVFVEDIENDAYLAMAPHIRYHPLFHPKGTNVNFATINSEHTIVVRTYERGVEAETLACGTGAIAVALAAAKVHGLPSPITIQTRSQDFLHISFNNGLTMTGPAIKTFEGVFF